MMVICPKNTGNLMTNLILPQHLTTNKAFTRVFQPKKLSFGLIAPFKGYPEGPIPNMDDHLELAKMADEGGFQLYGFVMSLFMTLNLEMLGKFTIHLLTLVFLPLRLKILL